MANPKNETSLAELKQRFADTDSLVLTEYRGLTVAQTTELRKALGADVQYSIAKNTLLVKAGKEMVQRYKDLTIGEIVVSREPMIQQRRVEIQNQLQESQDKFLDQKVNP